ncbi:MAG: N-acetylmuramoyl-L-alanine amidase [Prevotella sp.]|nr:N-acetylmuramoyl-L-alanine amidase [Prevotella sp.]
MGKRLLTILVICFSVMAVAVAGDKKFVLVIDAGHGGHDPGAKGAVAYEKNINLKVALAFGQYVERNCPDVKVIYTRKTDVFIPLNERAAIANRNKADLFISIHSNALPAGKISRGFETYTLGMHRAADNLEVAKRENSVILIEQNYKQRYAGFDPRSSESYIMFELMQDKNMANSVELAKMIQREACALSGRQNKGVHQAGFLVLRATSMPSCLIELGFISTPDEEQYLNSATGQDQLAHGIFNAFVKYKNKYGSGQAVAMTSQTATPAPESSSTKTSRSSRSSKRKGEQSEQQPAQQQSTPQQTTPQTSQRSTRQQSTPQPSQRSTRQQTTQQQSLASSVEPLTPSTNQPSSSSAGLPVFKVQILSSNRSLRPGSAQFQGVENVEAYAEGGSIKYTVGASTDYNEMARLRRSLLDKFPEAFVVAFLNGEKIDVNEAIRLFREKR